LRPKNIDPVISNIATARKFYATHQYPAAAVHARIAFELSLKRTCERSGMPVRFQTDPRKLTTDDLLRAVEVWLKDHPDVGPMAKPIQNVKLFRKVVLNPFSHSTPVNLTAAEVIGSVDAVEKLHQAFKDYIK
jgi:hypothetical protein